MLSEKCKKCKSAVWEQLKGVDGIGHVVDCEYAGVDVFTRMLFFDDIMHTVVVCPYFAQRDTDKKIIYREWNTDEETPCVRVEVHTDGDTLWVNSGSRCEVRIVGLNNLKDMRSTKAVMYKSDDIKDVMIIGEQ